MSTINRMLMLALKEALQIVRDRATLGMVLGVPLAQLTLFGFAVELTPRALAVTVSESRLGLLFSTLARVQMQAMQMTFFFFLPSSLLSGFMFPFSAMPAWAPALGRCCHLHIFCASFAV